MPDMTSIFSECQKTHNCFAFNKYCRYLLNVSSAALSLCVCVYTSIHIMSAKEERLSHQFCVTSSVARYIQIIYKTYDHNDAMNIGKN